MTNNIGITKLKTNEKEKNVVNFKPKKLTSSNHQSSQPFEKFENPKITQLKGILRNDQQDFMFNQEMFDGNLEKKQMKTND